MYLYMFEREYTSEQERDKERTWVNNAVEEEQINQLDSVQPIFIKYLIFARYLGYEDECDAVEIILVFLPSKWNKWLTSVKKEWETTSYRMYNLSCGCKND